MYADRMTDSMKQAIEETTRRRVMQEAYNRQHGITPQGIRKTIHDITERVRAIAETKTPYAAQGDIPKDDLTRLVKDLEKQMKDAAHNLEFEKAALLRDQDHRPAQGHRRRRRPDQKDALTGPPYHLTGYRRHTTMESIRPLWRRGG